MRLSEALITTICGYIRQGKTLSGAAKLAGVNRATAIRWRDKESDRANLYQKFYEELTQAHKDYEQSLLSQMQDFAANGERLTKVKEVTDPDGKKTVTREISENNKYNSVKWLLEKKIGYDQIGDRASEKTLNRLVKIAQKTLSPEILSDFLEAIMEDSFLCNLEIENIDGILNNESES